MKFLPFRSRKAPRQEDRPAPRGAADARCYAIGDVHGCLDQLAELLGLIARDNALRGPAAKAYLVMLGDLIDRGPDSRGVVDLVRSVPLTGMTVVSLLGNHEELFLRILDGESGLMPRWLQYGGLECALSYGVGREALLAAAGDDEAMAALLRASVPEEHIAFLKSCGDGFRFGDYLFVHAGIRPGVAIDAQDVADLRWIREQFLDSDADHGVVVVHGHTISDEPDEQANRIGIDTGAYATGRLTAIAIEGEDRWYLSAEGEPSWFG
ncbi:metallophosphoesterase family protein [Edaphosphingomonas haloaromaticamans]|uniref:Diadenosine tetraphosphatase n=1 Tax=Edaphosphingomonas haloaromaticamans TaxID=653954 RepID=A0A1S1HF54_9SPHN|nr:metallophosphoesterase family protein [Sphingomonas haloaromaticamans]OHT20855.1 diadenosine tetraphosphatase [Sphingomonas haloaromaticamans]